MKTYNQLIVTAIFGLFLISSGASTMEHATIDFESWNQFSDQIDECESANCILDDQMETVNGDFVHAKLDTGDTGFCGTAGLQKDIVVPSTENVGLVLSLQKAQLDNWGGRVGIKANDEWLITFNSEGGESKVYDHTDDSYISDEALYMADISEYAGEEVTFKLATEDLSKEWCNMPDHEQSIEANLLLMVSDIQNGEFTSDSDWEEYQRNQVNCESQYNCESDEKQPLDTNEISDGQLVLSSGMGSSDGHCGTYGREQWVYVPKADTVELDFEASAELDEWGGNLGVMFDEDWVFTFNDTGGEGQKTYEMQERTRDVSEYAGEYVSMRIAYQDDSGSWCDMHDHDRKMTVESIGFQTSGDQGDQANRPPNAKLTSQRFAGTTVSFDASDTTDPDDGKGDLESRWDWNNDGTWDTGWLSVLQTSHTYSDSLNQATAKVKIRDGDGGSDTATKTVQFGNSDDGDNGESEGSSGNLNIPANGWTVASFTSDVQKSKFSNCGSSATAYHAGSQYGFLRTADLTTSGTLNSGEYFIHSTSDSACTVSDVDLDTSGDTGSLEIPSNGWAVTDINEGVNKDEFSNCGSSATAYYAGDNYGFLRTADLTTSGTLNSGEYFIHSTSDSSCTVNLPGSEEKENEEDEGDGEEGDGEETNYASTEDEWCQTNGHGEALSSFRDDVSAGCKAQEEILGTSGGSAYYGAGNPGMSCADSEGYICER